MSDQKVKNAANEEELKEAREKDRHADQRQLNDWKKVMASDEGFRVLMEVLRFCQVDFSPLGGADRDVFARIGRQNVGRFLKSQMILADRRKYLEQELKLGEQL